ncbi:hypothetical protein KC717_06625 [Candidatus Dojkabacteria bacterium]|uniref:Uncharacterized protein n=1 Tax=Candidatus Dojkabacteria bacterium TaxID=2099670 RepID=A0A955RKZ5_9BACT|nr:hypothetical protein [Candidatus Dojkabacteria bacterium]
MAQQKVISRKVVGSAHPVARKFRDIKNAFAGVGCGFGALIIGFILIVTSVTSVKEYSKIVAGLPLQSPEEAQDGIVKIQGQPTINEPVSTTYQLCKVQDCGAPGESRTTTPSLYEVLTWERYEIVEETSTETRTVIENGQEVQETVETIEYNERWIEKDRSANWADFQIGTITVLPEGAKTVLETSSTEVPDVHIPNAGIVENFGQQVSDQVGATRLKIEYIPESTDQLIVVGELTNGTIADGETLIVSNLSNDELVTKLENQEATARLAMRFFAWLLLTIGFGAILAPILEFVELIPVAGKVAKVAAFFISAVFSAFLVLTGVLLLKFWYIFAALGVVLFIGSIILITKHVQSKS